MAAVRHRVSSLERKLFVEVTQTRPSWGLATRDRVDPRLSLSTACARKMAENLSWMQRWAYTRPDGLPHLMVHTHTSLTDGPACEFFWKAFSFNTLDNKQITGPPGQETYCSMNPLDKKWRKGKSGMEKYTKINRSMILRMSSCQFDHWTTVNQAITASEL